MGITLIVIHGVGDHPKGVGAMHVARAITGETLADSPIKVTEFNWDDIHPSPKQTKGRVSDFPAFTNLPFAIRKAAGIGFTGRSAGTLSRIALRLASWMRKFLLASLLGVTLLWGASVVCETFIDHYPYLRIGLPMPELLFPMVPNALLAGLRSALGTALFGIGIPATAGGILISFLIPIILRTHRASEIIRTLIFDVLWLPIRVVTMWTYVLLPPLVVAVLFFFYFFLMKSGSVSLENEHVASSGPGWLGLLLVIGAIVVIGGVAALIYRVARIPLKIMANIVLYLGDDEYYHRIHRALQSKLNQIEGGEHIILAAHSLGSAIALDRLREDPKLWRRFGSVRLLSMGSPLRRFFSRFFPTVYPSPDDCAKEIAAELGAFRWVNVYRPKDYIGTDLFKESREPHWDESTEQHQIRLLQSHSNYWSDETVRDKASPHLGSPLEPQHPVRSQRQPIHSARDIASETPRKATLEFVLLTVLFTLTGIAIVWHQALWVPSQERKHYALWMERIDSATKRVRGEVRLDVHRSASGQWAVHEEPIAVLGYAPPNAKRIEVHGYIGDFPHVDWDGMLADLKETPAKSLPRPRFQVTVECWEDDGEIFRVPSYAVEPSYYDFRRITIYILRILVCGFVSLFWIGIPFLFMDTPRTVFSDASAGGHIRDE